MLDPQTSFTTTPASSRTCNTPKWARPPEPPEPRARPISRRVMRLASQSIVSRRVESHVASGGSCSPSTSASGTRKNGDVVAHLRAPHLEHGALDVVLLDPLEHGGGIVESDVREVDRVSRTLRSYKRASSSRGDCGPSRGVFGRALLCRAARHKGGAAHRATLRRAKNLPSRLCWWRAGPCSF